MEATELLLNNIVNKNIFKTRGSKRKLIIADVIIATLIVGPLVVANWRGIWTLFDLHPHRFPAIQCFLLTGAVHFGFALLRDIFTEWLSRIKRYFVKKLICVFYILVFDVLCNLQWRSAWVLMDELCDVGDTLITTPLKFCNLVMTISTLILILSRTLCNISGPPCMIMCDGVRDAFYFPTRFKIKMMQGTSWYILDCLFSVIVVGTLVVLVWRGVWVLMDIYIYPDDPIWSAWASTIIGYSIVAVAFSMQPLMRWLCDRIDGCWRLIVCDLFLLLALVGTVNVWRGIWLLLNFYFLPDDLEMSCWITHWASLVLLILMGCSNSLLVRGVFIDAEEPAGKCVVFPCYYLRLIFQQEREKKSKLAQIELMAQRKLEMEKSNHHNPVRINMDANNHM